MMHTAHPTPSRRHWLLASAGTAVASTLPTATPAQTPLPATATSGSIPLVPPRAEFVYEAVADLVPPVDLGTGPLGERRMVSILGGSFEGPGLRGKILGGGADRQLLRPDGTRLLDALYEMQTDDGIILTVHNQVMSRADGEGKSYRFSHINITAPQGRYGWLNQFVYVGTLHSLQPARRAVVIRVYRLV